jgi:hypothetical protein
MGPTIEGVVEEDGGWVNYAGGVIPRHGRRRLGIAGGSLCPACKIQAIYREGLPDCPPVAKQETKDWL